MDATTTTSALATSQAASPEESGLGPVIRYAWVLVRRNLLLISAILAATVASAVVLTMLQTPQYTATSTIEINQQSEKVLGEELQSDSTGDSSWDIDLFLNTQLQILRSRALAQRVAQRLDLATSERFFAAMEQADVFRTASEPQRFDTATSLVRGALAVDLPRGTRIAEIRFTSTEPQMSADIANAYAVEFIQANLQRKFDSSAYARSFVAEQLEETRVRLESSERELNAYARQAGLIRTRDPSNEDAVVASSVTAASLMQLNQSANMAQAERIASEARWNAERAQPLFAS